MIRGLTESNVVLQLLAEMQPIFTSSSGLVSEEERVATLAKQLTDSIPTLLIPNESSSTGLPASSEELDSLQLVLVHEVERYNVLLQLVSDTLRNVRLAVAGTLLMTPALERTASAFLENKARSLFPSSLLAAPPLMM